MSNKTLALLIIFMICIGIGIGMHIERNLIVRQETMPESPVLQVHADTVIRIIEVDDKFVVIAGDEYLVVADSWEVVIQGKDVDNQVKPLN
jgi:hypothetical protein